MLHDPERYPSPEVFKPERYIRTDTTVPEEDPRNIVFGYGRRFVAG